MRALLSAVAASLMLLLLSQDSGQAGLDAVFLVSALVVLGSAAIALRLAWASSPVKMTLARHEGT